MPAKPRRVVQPATRAPEGACEPADHRTHDNRQIVKGDDLVALLLAAAKALQIKSSQRFAKPGPSWPALRAAFHVLPAEERRLAIALLVLEQAARDANDITASWNGDIS